MDENPHKERKHQSLYFMSLLYAVPGILCHPHYDFSKEEPKARESLICLGNPGENMAFGMFSSVAIEQSHIRARSPSAEACLRGKNLVLARRKDLEQMQPVSEIDERGNRFEWWSIFKS